MLVNFVLAFAVAQPNDFQPRQYPAPQPPGYSDILDAIAWNKSLKSGEWPDIASVLQDLQFNGDESQSTLPPLHALLEKFDGEKRHSVAYTILRVSNGDPKAQQVLDAVKPNERVRGRIKDLADKDKRKQALQFLGDHPIESRAALPAVRELLKTATDTEGVVIARVVWRLEPGDQDAIGYILKRMDSKDVALRGLAAECLRMVGRGNVAVTRVAVDRVNRETDKNVRLTLFDLLCRTAPTRGVWSKAAAEAMAGAIKGDEGTRRAAAVNLGMLREAAGLVTPVLLEVAANPKESRDVRDALATTLSRFVADDEQILQVVLDTLLEGGIQEAVGICLILNESPRSAKLVLPAVVAALNDPIRSRRAAQALGYMEGAAAPALLELEAFTARTKDPTAAALARQSIKMIRQSEKP